VSEWQDRSVGLVLSGGGGKGAYEIGCWKGMISEGIKEFKAVSGTSIGGLNGFLVCASDVTNAEKDTSRPTAMWSSRQICGPPVWISAFATGRPEWSPGPMPTTT
jgi:predicted acylesterase/phospholipase RssA